MDLYRFTHHRCWGVMGGGDVANELVGLGARNLGGSFWFQATEDRRRLAIGPDQNSFHQFADNRTTNRCLQRLSQILKAVFL